MEALKSLLLLSEKTPPAETGADALEILRQGNDFMRDRMEKLRTQIAETRKELPFSLASSLRNAAWVEEQRARLEQEIEISQTQCDALQDILQKLIPNPPKPDDIVFGSN